MSTGPGKLVIPMFMLGLLSGAALGSWGQRALFHRRLRGDMLNAQRALDRLDRELHLDATQKEAVKKILFAKQIEIAAQEKEHREKAEVLRHSVRGELAAVLNAEQQAQFAAMCERADKRIKERWTENR